MPEFIYAGQVPASYTETRDAEGFITGTVEHGDTREFGEPGAEKPEGAPEFWPAPDGRWVPAGTEIAEAWEGVGADMYRLPEGAPEDTDDGAGLHAHPGFGQPVTGTEHPAGGTWSPEVSSDGPAGSEISTASAELSGTSGE